MFTLTSVHNNLNRIYDQGFASDFHEDFFRHSGFSNFGYWDKPGLTGDQAAERLVLRLLEPIQPLQGFILDVACGQGGTTACLNTYLPGSQILAINISEQQLSAAQSHAPECAFQQMSATRLALEDNSVDGILCVEAVFHFETRRRFLNEVKRVLKPGGWLALTDVFFRFQPPSRIIPPANRIRTLDAYKQLYLDAGLSSPKIEHALKPSWQSCRNALKRFSRERLKKNPDPTYLKEYMLNELRCRIYDAAIADYLLVWSSNPGVL